MNFFRGFFEGPKEDVEWFKTLQQRIEEKNKFFQNIHNNMVDFTNTLNESYNSLKAKSKNFEKISHTLEEQYLYDTYKLFQIKIEGVHDKKLSFGQYLLRAVILNNVIISVLLQVIVYMMDVNSYEFFYRNLNLAGYIIQYATLFLVFVRRDGRGLHDLVAGTKVVFTEEENKKRLEQIQEEEKVLTSELEKKKKDSKKKDVVDAHVIDKKNVVKKREKVTRKK